LALPGNQIIANPTGANNDGGSITLVGDTLTWSGSGASPLLLNANFFGQGVGGFVSVTTSGNQTIGKQPGQFKMITNGGTSGGTISFTTNGILTVNAANGIFNDNNSLGGILQLTGGTVVNQGGGTLVLTKNALGGVGGSISITLTNASLVTPIVLGASDD